MSLFAGLENINEEYEMNALSIVDEMDLQNELNDQITLEMIQDRDLDNLNTLKNTIKKHGYTDALANMYDESLSAIGITDKDNIVDSIDKILEAHDYVESSEERMIDILVDSNPILGGVVVVVGVLLLGVFAIIPAITYLINIIKDIKSYKSQYDSLSKEQKEKNLDIVVKTLPESKMTVVITSSIKFITMLEKVASGGKLDLKVVKSTIEDMNIPTTFWAKIKQGAKSVFVSAVERDSLKDLGYTISSFAPLEKNVLLLNEKLLSIKRRNNKKAIKQEVKQSKRDDTVSKEDKQTINDTIKVLKFIIQGLNFNNQFVRRALRAMIGHTGMDN